MELSLVQPTKVFEVENSVYQRFTSSEWRNGSDGVVPLADGVSRLLT
jgi:hypothetical protein